MELLIEAYLAALVEDAAHALCGRYSFSWPQPDCEAALRRLATGRAGTDQMVDAASALTGLDATEIFSRLLDQARALADVMEVPGYRSPKSRAAA